MKKYLKKILLLGIFSLQIVLTNTQIASAEDPATLCPKLNNISGSIKQQEDKKDSSQDAVALADKLVVITEEPLGTPDNETTFICFREINCSVKSTKDTSKKPETTKEKRVCETQYTGTCNGATPQDQITKIQSDPKSKETYKTCERIMVYLSPAGTNLLYYYIGQIYRYVAFLGGIIAVLTIIIAGLLMTTAGDNSDQLGKAKAIIVKCITGLVLLFLSAIILYVINPNFFVLQ